MWRTEVAHLLPAVVVCVKKKKGWRVEWVTYCHVGRGEALLATWRAGTGPDAALGPACGLPRNTIGRWRWPSATSECYWASGPLAGFLEGTARRCGAFRSPVAVTLLPCGAPSTYIEGDHVVLLVVRGGGGTTWSFVFAFSVGIDCSTLPPLGPSPVPPRPLLALP
ncbi:hypothetical protein BHM03_00004848 [Ensete ventricosum]|nr:hypothetical protein BHM03_00004848 [Ensete ventricosum]